MKNGNKIANWIIVIVFAALIGVAWYAAVTPTEPSDCRPQLIDPDY